ncbi:hypothetical protein SUGI_0977270 [Cryptomeria japonica]|nr:hypothetical protein SUGI_0977270 [Cryptomeria japonica]
MLLGGAPHLIFPCLCLAQNGVRPATVNVGAIVSYNTTIGRVSRKAIELAVEDVNNDKTLLNETQLVLTMVDSNRSAFIGTLAAFELSKKDVVAIIGPESSVTAHVISHIANGLQLPLLSFGATDRSLSSPQYPYFFRFTHSDSSEMMAVAAVISHFNWKEIVAVYVDDDYGRNGINALGDAFGNIADIVVHKHSVPPEITKTDLSSKLKDLSLMATRVFVVHMNPDAGLKLFTEAHQLGMLSNGYVWIATDWLSTTLDSLSLDSDTMNSLQGVISMRQHIPNSNQLHAFSVRWNNLQKARTVDAGLNVFGLYAYDTVWAIASAIDKFFKNGGNISFTDHPQLSTSRANNSKLTEFKVFRGGSQLHTMLLQTNFKGLTGSVQLNKNGDLLGSTFEIINIVGSGIRKVSYWSNISALSVIPPESGVIISHNKSNLNKEVYDLVWPGGRKQKPQGWTVPNNSGRLRFAVPFRKGGFKKLEKIVQGSNVTNGYCINVFSAAVKMLPYDVPYEFVVYGSEESPPMYDDLVKEVASKKFDAAVGDISILKKRSMYVDFTQPYAASDLVVVVPVKKLNSNPWGFLQPFTREMWFTTVALFLAIGAIIWLLEHRLNSDFRGEPMKQFVTILSFSISTTLLIHKGKIVSGLGRIILVIWLFVVLVISSSYKANLTSSLTVQQLSSTIDGIDDLISSNLPIGYFRGSFVRNFLSEELNVSRARLIPFDSPEDYAKALSEGPSRGGIGAIVEELPTVQFFLSIHSGFKIAGQPFTKDGWGFAFQKGSPLRFDISTAILNLSETGKLQQIRDECLGADGLISHVNLKQLGLKSFRNLFVISGMAIFAVFLGFACHLVLRLRRHPRTSDGLPNNQSVVREVSSSVDWEEIAQRNNRPEKRETEEQGEINQIISE